MCVKYNKDTRKYPTHIGDTNYAIFKGRLVRRNWGILRNKETDVFCILEQDPDLVLVLFLQ